MDARLQACMDVAALRRAGWCTGEGTGLLLVVTLRNQPDKTGCHFAWVWPVSLTNAPTCAFLPPCNKQACSMLLQQPRCWRRSWQAAPTLTQHSMA